MPSDDQFKSYAVNALSREICALSGAAFEQWAYGIMPYLSPTVAWHHRGTTSLGAPVGYTVDSSGAHAVQVAQYSSVRNYFGDTKPIDDLGSTLDKHPHVEIIWLLAAVESTPTERTELDNALATWKKQYPHVQVRELDSRQIAAEIFDRLDSDDLVRKLQDRLPSLARIADENAFSHSLPKLENYVSRPEQELSVQNLLASRRYAIVAGFSGVGKSVLATRIATLVDAETRIWQDATHLSTPGELRSVCIGRRGLAHNLAHALRARRCVLVLDNLKSLWRPEVFAELAGPHSFVLATSQVAGPRDDVVVLGNPNSEEAKRILELDDAPACPEATFRRLLDATAGHPLLLSREPEQHEFARRNQARNA